MADLEPYLCTYGGCLRPAKTYGIRNDWIQHEIDVHEIEKKWFCKPCDQELSSRQAFDDHMRKKHFEFTRKPQLDAFAEICEMASGKMKSRTICPLCLRERRNEKKLRRYVLPWIYGENGCSFQPLFKRTGFGYQRLVGVPRMIPCSTVTHVTLCLRSSPTSSNTSFPRLQSMPIYKADDQSYSGI